MKYKKNCLRIISSCSDQNLAQSIYGLFLFLFQFFVDCSNSLHYRRIWWSIKIPGWHRKPSRVVWNKPRWILSNGRRMIWPVIWLRLQEHHSHNHNQLIHLDDSACQGVLCFICCFNLFYLGLIQKFCNINLIKVLQYVNVWKFHITFIIIIIKYYYFHVIIFKWSFIPNYSFISLLLNCIVLDNNSWWIFL